MKNFLDTLLTGNALLFNGKKISCISGISYFRISRFLECASHKFNGKFTLNLCDTQVFKIKNFEISC